MSRDSIAAVMAGTKRWCVVHADCLDVLPTFDLALHGDRLRVITDGPYGVGGYANTSDDGPYVAALRMVAECQTIAFFGYAETIVAWIISLGWSAPDEWVTWYPSNAEAKAGAQSKHRLPKLTEHIAIYGDTPRARELRRERSAGGAKLAGKSGLNALRRYSPDAALRSTAQLGDVWTDPSPGVGFHAGRRLHENEKPESLMSKLVTLTSVPGDVVIDPFAGSGTTGVAALRLGRRCILIEKDATYAKLAHDRLAAEEAGSTLAAARAGQLPLLGGTR